VQADVADVLSGGLEAGHHALDVVVEEHGHVVEPVEGQVADVAVSEGQVAVRLSVGGQSMG
jgi:hypothetical protein